LFPDNRILSRAVLEEIMNYASRHRVQVAVFNKSLLERGAIFSASAVPADIAETIAGVLESQIGKKNGQSPVVSALSEVKIDTNPLLLQKFGLETDQTITDASVADAQ
jgi:hypothetical protein